jgi:hypothetical protein
MNFVSYLFPSIFPFSYLLSFIVTVLNQAPPHEDVLESGVIAPRILVVGIRWR